MRTEILLLLALTGCQAVPPPKSTTPALPASAPSLELQEKALRQQQHIRALIAQNEALHGRVRELETPPPVPAEPVAADKTAAPPVAEAGPVHPADRPLSELTGVLTPNADGVIDLAALATQSEETNPFAVRSLPADAVREITLHLSGLIQGATPCALVNGRPVEPGETVETLTLVRIEPEAAVFRHGPHLLRLPVAEKPVRLRLAL